MSARDSFRIGKNLPKPFRFKLVKDRTHVYMYCASLLESSSAYRQLPQRGESAAPILTLASRFEIGFNLFKSLAFGFRQEKGRDDKVNHGKGGEHEEHRGIAVLADKWQEDARQSG